MNKTNQNEPKRVSAALAKYSLSELVDRARQFGEVTIIQRYGRDSAIIAPIESLKRSKTAAK